MPLDNMLNVDIFACIKYCKFAQIFAWIYIRVFDIIAPRYCIIKVIFTVFIFSRIFGKRGKCENIYNAKISTFTVFLNFIGSPGQ